MSVYDKDLPQSEGIYHKFEDNKTYTVRFASEPIVVVSTFKGTESTKYAWLAWNVEARAPQIIRLPKGGAQEIWKLAREKGDPTEYSLRITRTGSGFDTKYKIEASPNKTPLSEIDSDAEALLAKVDPIEMINKGNGIVDVYWLSEAEDGEPKSRADSQPAPVDEPFPSPKDGGEEEPW